LIISAVTRVLQVPFPLPLENSEDAVAKGGLIRNKMDFFVTEPDRDLVVSCTQTMTVG